MKIQKIIAREIVSSGSTPSLAVTVMLEKGIQSVASVPFGASTGSHEAVVLLDGDSKRYLGQGMLKAVKNVNTIIGPRLVGQNVFDQKKMDQIMIDLDGTSQKSRLGGNAILGVSSALARAGAVAKRLPLYQYLRSTFALPYTNYLLPKPMMVCIEGGKHAENSTDLQEYMVTPIGAKSAAEAVRWGIECYLHLKKILHAKGYATTVGNEGAFAPSNIPSNEAPLPLLLKAIRRAGYRPGIDVALSLDPATSEIFSKGMYHLKRDKKVLNTRDMIAYFARWIRKYPIAILEDPLHEDDWDGWVAIMRQLGKKVMIVGDDLTVTNPRRLQQAIDQKAINAILIKLNQIGTVTETIDTCTLASAHDITPIVSHRGGGETNDTFMIDLAVAVNAEFVKVGPSRGERVEKYNRLMEIEEELSSR